MSKYNRQTPCVFIDIEAMFHGIPKNASTSIKHLLYEANYGRKFQGPGQWIHKGNEKGGCIYPSLAAVQSVVYESFKHFTVVRNPFDRFISFYTDLCLGSTNLRAELPPFFTDNNIQARGFTVDQAVDMVCEYTNDDEIDEHIASQSSFVYVDNCDVLKMETLDCDWGVMCKKLNIDYHPVPVYNKSNTTVHLTEEQKDKLYDRYKQDFERFKYER